MPRPDASYRDPRNGAAIEASLADIARSAGELVERLRFLHEVLEPDIELTPRQAHRLGEQLGAVGMLGAALLVNDYERTANREDAYHRDPTELPPH